MLLANNPPIKYKNNQIFISLGKVLLNVSIKNSVMIGPPIILIQANIFDNFERKTTNN